MRVRFRAAMLARALGAVAGASARFPLAVLTAAVLLAGGAGYHAAGHLGLYTETAGMLSPELPFRQTYDDFKAAFPQLDETIVVVVDGNSADAAEDAALILAKTLAAEPTVESVFYPPGEDYFRNNALLFKSEDELSRLVDRIAEAQPLLARLAGDMSLRGFFSLLGEASDKVAAGEAAPDPLLPLFAAVTNTLAAFESGVPEALSWRGLLEDGTLGPDERRQIVLVEPRVDLSSLAPAAETLAAVRRAAGALALGPGQDIRVRLTGGTVIREAELASVRDGALRASVVALVAVAFLLFTGLRSPRLVAAQIATLVIGLVWTTGFAALAVGRLNLLSVAFAVLFIGLTIDFGIQLGLRYLEARGKGRDHLDSLRAAAGGSGPAIMLAALCAAIGFFAFAATDYIGLSQLGIIAGGGMFIGAGATFTVLPAMLSLLPPGAKPARAAMAIPAAQGLARLVVGRRRWILAGAAALLAGAIALLPWARFDIDPINLKDPADESIQTYFDLVAASRNRPYSANVLAPDLPAARRLAEVLETLPVVESTLTLASFVPRNQERKLAQIETLATFMLPIVAFTVPVAPPGAEERRAALGEALEAIQRLAASSHAGTLAGPARALGAALARVAALAAQDPAAVLQLEEVLLVNLPGRLAALGSALEAGPVGIEDLPASLVDRYRAQDGRHRVEIVPAVDVTDAGALARFVAALRTLAPNVTGHPVLLLEGGRAVIGALETAGAIAFLAILLLLFAVRRRVFDVFAILAPLAVGALLTSAVMTLSGLAFNFSNIVGLPLIFSLGISFGIYFVSRGEEAPDPAGLFTTSTPRAVLLSALTTIASFGSLAVSSHRGMASMGALLAIGLSMVMIATFLLLPTLLAFRRGRSAGSP